MALQNPNTEKSQFFGIKFLQWIYSIHTYRKILDFSAFSDAEGSLQHINFEIREFRVLKSSPATQYRNNDIFRDCNL